MPLPTQRLRGNLYSIFVVLSLAFDSRSRNFFLPRSFLSISVNESHVFLYYERIFRRQLASPMLLTTHLWYQSHVVALYQAQLIETWPIMRVERIRKESYLTWYETDQEYSHIHSKKRYSRIPAKKVPGTDNWVSECRELIFTGIREYLFLRVLWTLQWHLDMCQAEVVVYGLG